MSLRNLPPVLATSLLSTLALAFSEDELSRFRVLPQAARVLLQANLNHRSLYNVETDVFLPLQHQSNYLFFTNIKSHYNNKQSGFVGLGAGFRYQLNPSNLILGTHCFIEHSWLAQSQGFSLLSPGIEVKHRHLSVTINGYFPITPNTRSVTLEEWNTDPQWISFEVRKQYNRRHKTMINEIIGPGLDIVFSKKFHTLNKLTLSGGAYYFLLPTQQNIWGLTADFSYPIHANVQFRGAATYDNKQHYTGTIGLLIQFGQQNLLRTTLQNHLEETPQRYLASRTYGTAVPILQHQKKSTERALQIDNLFFFSSDQPSMRNHIMDESSCTAEAPCSTQQLSTKNLEKIAALVPKANLYITGTKPISKVGDETITLIVPPGLSIFGRSPDFKQAANSQNFPLFYRPFRLQGHNRIQAIKIENTEKDYFKTGISIENAQKVHIHNTYIDLNYYPKHQNDRDLSAVLVSDSNDVNLQGNFLRTQYSKSSGGSTRATVWIINSQAIRMEHNRISNQLNKKPNVSYEIDAYRGLLVANSSLQLNHNKISVETEAKANAGAVEIGANFKTKAGTATIIQAKANQFYVTAHEGEAMGILFAAPGQIFLNGQNHFYLKVSRDMQNIYLLGEPADKNTFRALSFEQAGSRFRKTETDTFNKELISNA